MPMGALHEFDACCCKESCAGNGNSIGKRDNEVAVLAKPCPEGLAAKVVIDMNRGSLASRFQMNRPEGFRLYYFDHGVFNKLHYCQKCHHHA